MFNYKITVTSIPNADVIAYPFNSDVIYATADNTGSVELTWTSESAEETRVIAEYNGVEQIEIVVPVLNTIPPNPLDYILFYDTQNASSQSGINEGQIVGNLTIESGYPIDASFGANGLVTSAKTTRTKASSGSLNSALRIRGDLTIMARIKCDDISSNTIIAAMYRDSESFDFNYLWSVWVLNSGLLYFSQEHDAGVNSDASASAGSALQVGQYYTIAVTRKDNGDGTNDISFYIDGQFVNTVGGRINPSGGAGSDFFMSSGDGGSFGFVGEVPKLIVGDFVATDTEILDAHNTWNEVA